MLFWGMAVGQLVAFALGKGRYGRRRGCSMEKDQRTDDQGDGGYKQSHYEASPGPSGRS